MYFTQFVWACMCHRVATSRWALYCVFDNQCLRARQVYLRCIFKLHSYRELHRAYQGVSIQDAAFWHNLITL